MPKLNRRRSTKLTVRPSSDARPLQFKLCARQALSTARYSRAGQLATADTCRPSRRRGEPIRAGKIWFESLHSWVEHFRPIGIGVNSYWAQGLKPPHFYDHGARIYDEPPTFVTWYCLNCVSIVCTGFTQCWQLDHSFPAALDILRKGLNLQAPLDI